MSFLRNNLSNKILFEATKNILTRNERFRDIHKGESCYIFGNGASIKYFDIEQFNDRITIGCGLLFLHKDFKKLNTRYYYTGHPFFYYPYWTNPYSKSFERNAIGSIYKSNIFDNNNIDYFVSLTNYLGISGDNINFVYHFNKLFNGIDGYDLSNKFSFSDGALASMIGIALFMGFETITLVGCDYASKPVLWGHFYEYGKRPHREVIPVYAEEPLLKAHQIGTLQTLTISSDYEGDIAKSITYQSFTEKDIDYKENSEIISHQNLLELNKTNMSYRIFPEE